MRNKFIVLSFLFLALFSIVFYMWVKKAGAKKSRVKKEVVLAHKAISLEDRYGNKYVNDVFKDNILLALFYMREGKVNALYIDWGYVQKPFGYELILKPNQIFAFHSDVLPKYIGRIDKTTNAHFNYQEGFKSDDYLT